MKRLHFRALKNPCRVYLVKERPKNWNWQKDQRDTANHFQCVNEVRLALSLDSRAGRRCNHVTAPPQPKNQCRDAHENPGQRKGPTVAGDIAKARNNGETEERAN